MNTLELSLTAIAIGFCLVCALLLRQVFARLSLVFLTSYLVLEGIGFGLEWLLVHPESPYKAVWLGLLMASSFLMAPCLWLFALETARNSRPPLSTLSRLDWGVVALGIFLTLPLILAAHDGSHMIEPDRQPFSRVMSSVIHETMLLSIALFLFQVPCYLIKCRRIVETHSRHSMVMFSNTSDMPLSSLRVLIWLMAGNWILVLLRTLRALTIDGPTVLDLVFTAAGVAITVSALYVIVKRSLLFNPEDQLLANEISIQELVSPPPAESIAGDQQPKYLKSSLNSTIRTRIERKLSEAMDVDKIYTRSNLRLRDLCDHLNENLHYVSQVINQSRGNSFYDLINHARIEAAKELLEHNPDKSILNIALEVGFNSKTTFNSAFKRATGLTPSQHKIQSSQLSVGGADSSVKMNGQVEL